MKNEISPVVDEILTRNQNTSTLRQGNGSYASITIIGLLSKSQNPGETPRGPEQQPPNIQTVPTPYPWPSPGTKPNSPAGRFQARKTLCRSSIKYHPINRKWFWVERKKTGGKQLVDLTAAYDVINHRTLMTQPYDKLRDYSLIKTIEALLCNRGYYLVLDREKDKVENSQRHGLPQGSVPFQHPHQRSTSTSPSRIDEFGRFTSLKKSDPNMQDRSLWR